VIVSGHDKLSDTSPTCATTIGSGQLSASSVTTVISSRGTSPIHCTFIVAGFDAVGSVISSTVIV